MVQRKLARDELRNANRAAWHLRNVINHCGLFDCGNSTLQHLERMQCHGTTDGKPYIDPQPEVGDGYRVATEADKDRRDLGFWSRIGGGWVARQTIYGTPLDPDYHYRVPIDRIPTDEDAKGRPTVMVRDRDDQNWRPVTLLAVRNGSLAFVANTPSNLLSSWAQARLPYPGELG